MALYLSNRGNFVFKSAVRRSGIDWGEEEGAGSIVGKSGLGVSFMGRQADTIVSIGKICCSGHGRLDGAGGGMAGMNQVDPD